jgi:hypothetical protein
MRDRQDGLAGDLPAWATIDPTVAHQARIYDYWLGGKDNFAADREAATGDGDQIAAYSGLARKP